MTAFVLTVRHDQPLKIWTDRAAPDYTLPERGRALQHALPPGEYDMATRPGHLVNTIVWYGVIALLLAPWLNRTARLVAARSRRRRSSSCTTIYLDFHWLTDSIAGLLLGVFIARLIVRVPWKI